MGLELPAKASWGDGPWQSEPDHAEWFDREYACVAHRHPNHGSWCGYVGVLLGHPWYERDDLYDVDVHGGVTCTAMKSGLFAETESMNPRAWWVGFDCNHWNDYAPGFAELERRMFGFRSRPGLVYRPLTFVVGECARLVSQAIAASSEGGVE